MGCGEAAATRPREGAAVGRSALGKKRKVDSNFTAHRKQLQVNRILT